MTKYKNILIGTYRPEKMQLDWILGVSPKRDYMLYNVRRNADLFSNRNGGSGIIKDVDSLVLYNYQDLSETPKLYRILTSAEATEQQMVNLRYPKPEGAYILFQIEELGRVDDINLTDYEVKNFYHLFEKYIQHVYDQLLLELHLFLHLPI